MVRFNELRISADSKYLVIDVSVQDLGYYDNVYLQEIIIDSQDTYLSSGPSSTPIYKYTISSNEDLKELRIVVPYQEVVGASLDGMFFVYVVTKGTPAADTPCGMDNITTMATVTNMYPFYQQAMQYVKELATTCSSPKAFADYILKLNAIELSIRTGNYPEAIKFYKKFFSGKSDIVIKGGCGCGNS